MEARFDIHVGQPVILRGYADDFEGVATAVRFTLDEGAHWTTYPIDAASQERGVSWTLEYTPQTPGIYLLRAQSICRETTSAVITTFAFEVKP